jgi:predicted nucleotidyltransferase
MEKLLMREFEPKQKKKQEEKDNIDWHSLELKDLASKYLEKRKIKGRIIFSMLSGSQSYNLHDQSSDNDYVSVFIASPKDFLNVRKTMPTSINTLLSEPQIPDMILWEIRTFFSLLLKGNPFAMACLWTDKQNNKSWQSEEEWKQIESLRNSLITKQTVEEHLSYVKEQLKWHEKKPLIGKRFYHCPRLVRVYLIWVISVYMDCSLFLFLFFLFV